jgi:hypothetical protein
MAPTRVIVGVVVLVVMLLAVTSRRPRVAITTSATTTSTVTLPPRVTSGCPVCEADVRSSTDCFASATASECRAAFPDLPELAIPTMGETDRVVVKRSARDVPITFVTAPRAFDEDTSVRQRASILSWHMQPGPVKEVLLFGDEQGIAELAEEWSLRHMRALPKSEDGIPLMSDLFREASRVANYGVVCFINADISLPPTWW